MGDLSDFLLLVDFQRAHPNIVRNVECLRWIIRHRDQNGLSKSGAVVKRQGRWFVHAGLFADWMMHGGDDQRRAI